jgi:enoyl-CoA hydratase/carnithine racemase
VGYSRAAEICVTARRVAADEALRIGLATSVVPLDQLDSAVDELVAQVLRPAPGATRETLALIASAASGVSDTEQLALERAAQLRRLAELAALAGSPSA